MPNLAPIMQLVVAVVVIVAGVSDIRSRRIPNWLVLAALLVGFALNTFLYGLDGLKYSGLGFGLAILVYMPLYLVRGMGAGDVKLMAALGALVGWRIWLIIFVITGLLGGVLALVLMLAMGRFRRTFSNLGFIVWDLTHFRAPHLRSEELDVTSPKSFRLPHGAVIALGCLAFLGVSRLIASQFGPEVALGIVDVTSERAHLRLDLQLFLYLQLLDFLTTLVGMRFGLQEASPFVRQIMVLGPVLGLLVSKLIAFVLAGLCLRIQKPHLIRVINYWFAALVLWNLCLILHRAGF